MSTIYLNLGFEIATQNDALDAAMALETRPQRLKSAPRRSSRRVLAVFENLLGRSWVPLDRFRALRAFLGVPSGVFGSYF